MSAIAKCPISGKEIEVPVYCTKTKMIYDKKEIERCISENGKCPITNIEISSDDIIEVNTNRNVPNVNTNNIKESFIDIVNKLKTEYCALVYEKSKLSKEYAEIESDLNEKIAKNEAAMLVIARLIKERDEIADELNGYRSKYGPLEEE